MCVGALFVLDLARRTGIAISLCASSSLKSERQFPPAGAFVASVPELFTRHHGVRATQLVAEALGQELGF